MSVPKKRKTSSKRDKGRSHLALKKTNLVSCTKCKAMIMPHKLCKFCGYYNGEEVIKIKTSLDKKSEKKEAKQ